MNSTSCFALALPTLAILAAGCGAPTPPSSSSGRGEADGGGEADDHGAGGDLGEGGSSSDGGRGDAVHAASAAVGSTSSATVSSSSGATTTSSSAAEASSTGVGGGAFCGDGSCDAGEAWPGCIDCSAPPQVVWSSIGGCASNATILDATGEPTWVREDSYQLVIGSCTVSNSEVTPDVPGGGGELYLSGQYIATITCLASQGGGCTYYWMDWTSNNAIDVYGDCAGGYTFAATLPAGSFLCY